ncbi:MAG: GNAT family N-acetyltransferase [Burkholderiaceae bacterium]|nr:GNAT family N-acetyltransferase [Burkholderiaceae bacterium]
MRVELHERSSPETQDLRSPTEGDIEALGELMYRAYLGTIDYEDETLEQSVAEIRKTYQGDYGRFDPEHSSIAERNGLVVSATLITRWQDRPFVAFSMTDPRFARQGLARASLERCMGLLRQDGEHELRLVVTLENEPAVNLYESLGFRQE